RGQDHDAALGFHVPLPVPCVLLRLLRALHGACCDDPPHDVIDIDAEDLFEQIFHPLTVHGEPDHLGPRYKPKLSMVSVLRPSIEALDNGSWQIVKAAAQDPRGRRAPLRSSENKIGRPRGSRSCLWVVEEGLLGWEGWLDDVDGFPIAAEVFRDPGRELEPHPQPAVLEE